MICDYFILTAPVCKSNCCKCRMIAKQILHASTRYEVPGRNSDDMINVPVYLREKKYVQWLYCSSVCLAFCRYTVVFTVICYLSDLVVIRQLPICLVLRCL